MRLHSPIHSALSDAVRPVTFASRRVMPSWKRILSPPSETKFLCAASHKGHGFDSSQYIEASVGSVRKDPQQGPLLHLKLKDGIEGSVLIVYVGEAESNGLLQEMNQQRPTRPMTYDLFKNVFERLGHKVVLVRITALVGSTYHARVHLRRTDGSGPDVDIDSRPSDAINLALRFHAPILVAKEVAAKMGQTVSDITPRSGTAGARSGALATESATDIIRSCRHEVSLYQDPTLMLKLQMQLSAEEERYEEASTLRDEIDRILARDQAGRLIVAIETALDDKRYEKLKLQPRVQEAARLRDDLQSLRSSVQQTLESDASTSF